MAVHPERERSLRMISGFTQSSAGDPGASSEDDADTGAHFTAEGMWIASEQRARPTALTWLFREDMNPEYANNLGLALRCATVLVVITMSLVVRREDSLVRRVANIELDMPASATIMYIFTVSPSTGATLDYAASGVLGTLLSVCNSWCMTSIFPHGAETDVAWYAMLVNGVCFAFLILLLHFNMNTRIFAVASFVFHWMAFMDPETRGNVHGGLHICLHGARMKELTGAVLGCGLAVLTTMVPQPIFAVSRAGDSARRLALRLDETWAACVRFMLASEADADVDDLILKKLAAIKSQLASMDQALDIASWEVIVLPARFGEKRLMLRRLVGLLREGYDRLFSIWHSCSQEQFEQSHLATMASVETELLAMLDATSALLHKSVGAALDGRISKHEAKVLEDLTERAGAAQVDLTHAFLKATTQVCEERVSPELLDEHCFCFHVCASARMAIDFANDLILHRKGERRLTAPPLESCNPFVVQFTSEHMSFVVRNFLTIWLGMFIGYEGYQKMVPRYNAGIACTTAILLSKFQGSAMAKALERLQGVVLGNIFGQLIYVVVARCNPLAYSAMAMVIFGWSTTTMLVYFHSPAAAGIAVLLAGFGTMRMGRVCSDGNLEPSRAPIVNTCIALTCAMSADVVLSLLPLGKAFKMRRASVMAVEAIRHAWAQIQAGAAGVLDADIPDTREHVGTFRQHLATAQGLGLEASKEFRWHRVPWKMEIFNSVAFTLARVRMTLGTLEHTASGGQAGGPKSEAFLRITRLPSFAEYERELQQTFDEVAELLLVLEQEHFTVEKDHAGATMQGLISTRSQSMDAMPSRSQRSARLLRRVFDDVTALEFPKPSKDGTLEEDGISVACVVVQCCAAMRADLRALRHQILRAE